LRSRSKEKRAKIFVPDYFNHNIQNIEIERIFLQFLPLCDAYKDDENS
jgi:hypothetical protein